MRTFWELNRSHRISTGVKTVLYKFALKCFIALLPIALLVACDKNNEPELTITPTNFAPFNDGSGIERYVLSEPRFKSIYHTYSNNIQSKYLIPDIRSDLENLPTIDNIEESNQNDTDPINVIAIKNQGSVTLQGRELQITNYIDVDAPVSVYFAHDNNSGQLLDVMIGGSQFIDSLPKGRTTYEGINLLTLRGSGLEIYEGEFKLQIDFPEGKGYLQNLGSDRNFATSEISDSNSSKFINLSGEFDINLQDGTFASELMTLQFCERSSCYVSEDGRTNEILED